MNRFERWFLKRLCRKIVTQGDHKRRIIEHYKILMEAAKEEFTEENKYGLDSFMQECFEKALK